MRVSGKRRAATYFGTVLRFPSTIAGRFTRDRQKRVFTHTTVTNEILPHFLAPNALKSMPSIAIERIWPVDGPDTATCHPPAAVLSFFPSPEISFISPPQGGGLRHGFHLVRFFLSGVAP